MFLENFNDCEEFDKSTEVAKMVGVEGIEPPTSTL